jgi:hypothetical protein
MRLLDRLATAAIAGFIVAVLVMTIQVILASTAVSDGAAVRARRTEVSLAMSGLIGFVAAGGALVLQWKKSSRKRRRPRT